MRKFIPSSILALSITVAIPAMSVAQDKMTTDKTVDTSRDARKNGPTADNQSNGEADRKLTADIRKAVVGDKSLSMAAHNVKIIARNGEVTLRGRVKTADEKQSIVTKAEDIAGKGKVTDQLMLSTGKATEKQPDK